MNEYIAHSAQRVFGALCNTIRVIVIHPYSSTPIWVRCVSLDNHHRAQNLQRVWYGLVRSEAKPRTTSDVFHVELLHTQPNDCSATVLLSTACAYRSALFWCGRRSEEEEENGA